MIYQKTQSDTFEQGKRKGLDKTEFIQSVQSLQKRTEENSKIGNRKLKKQAKKQTLNKLQDSAATIDNQNRK